MVNAVSAGLVRIPVCDEMMTLSKAKTGIYRSSLVGIVLVCCSFSQELCVFSADCLDKSKQPEETIPLC